MAIGGIDIDGLNEAAAGAGEGLKAGTVGALSFTESVTGLAGVLSDLSNTLDYVTRNPLLSFTFFERIGRSLQKDLISNLRISKNLTDEQVASWNRWGTAVNFTSSAILSFATKVASLQLQLRQASIESSRYFNTMNMPYGTSYETTFQIHKNQALQTLKLSSEFGKAYTEVTQSLGRYITPQTFQKQANINSTQAQQAYENYLETITLYARKFPNANIPELTQRIYSKFGGYGMTPYGAAGAAMSFAKKAGAGGYISTAGVGENVNELLSLINMYTNKGMGREEAFQAAQMTLTGFGGLRGAAGEPMSLENVQRLTRLFPQKGTTQSLIAKGIGINAGDISGPEGPLRFAAALQQWTKKQGVQNMGRGEVANIVSSKLGGEIGASIEDLMAFATAPDFKFNTKSLKDLAETFNKLNTSQLDLIKKSVEGVTDPNAVKYRAEEKRIQNLPDVIGGAVDYTTTMVSKLADEFGVSPLLIQSLIAGGVGAIGIRKLLSLGHKMKTALPALMGGKTVGEIPASVLGEFAGGTATKTGASILGSTALRVASKAVGVVGAALLFKDILDDLEESSKEAQYRSGRKTRPVPLPKAFSDLAILKKIGVVNTPEQALSFLEKEGVSGIRDERAFLPQGKDISLKNLDLYNMTDKVSSTLTYSSALKSKDIMKKAQEEGETEGKLHVIFSTAEGADLGETIMEKGKEAFININLGAVLNSMRG